MTTDKRTRGQLLNELDEAERRVADAELVAYRAQRDAGPVNIEAPARIPEADALAACIRALDALSKSDSTSGSLGYRSYSSGDIVRQLNTTQRVIEALAVKYQMPPEKPVMVECHRRHVEDMSPVELVATIQGGRPF